jgi:predicted alpha/beta-fold hydrolase
MSESLLRELEIPRFRPRAPWWGPDLQTSRDTLRGNHLEDRQAQPIPMPVEPGAHLLGMLDPPLRGTPQALVLLCHGLGGSSEAEGPRRLAMALREQGFAVLRLNLRGAGGGRALAPGSYAADCSRDLLPVLRQARALALHLGGEGSPVPLAGAGISLGGTILLNARAAAQRLGDSGIDALVCISSPIDLHACAHQFERPRNRVYQRWLVRRLRRQVLADPHGISPEERQALQGPGRPRTIRAFDALITAPRWGYDSVEHYYTSASPVHWLAEAPPLSPTLLVHAADDPWVPADPAVALAERLLTSNARRAADVLVEPAACSVGARPAAPAKLEVCITACGGHNGFHGLGDHPTGCWSDRLTARWLQRRLWTGNDTIRAQGHAAAEP